MPTMKPKYTHIEIQELAYKWRKGTISAAEKQAYEDWYSSHNDNIGVLEESFGSEDAIQQRLWLDISAKLTIQDMPVAKESTRSRDVAPSFIYSLVKSNVFKIAAAAAVVLLCYFGFRGERKGVAPEIPTIALQITKPENDAVTYATLVLTSGDKLNLDLLKIGDVVSDQSFSFRKVGPQKIVYNLVHPSRAEASNASQEILLPKHATYELVLADGTAVWMNAWSKLRVFDNLESSKRTVHLAGEAYFEVAKTKQVASFTVLTADQNINVLGTHFNVRAYGNSPTTTSLLEGSVRIVANKTLKSLVLQPGQAAMSRGTMLVEPFDVEHVMAWRDDVFYFNATDLRDVLQELERWYPLSVDYSVLPEGLRFSGKVSRSRSLDEILDAIERTSHVKFKLTGGRLKFEK